MAYFTTKTKLVCDLRGTTGDAFRARWRVSRAFAAAGLADRGEAFWRLADGASYGQIVCLARAEGVEVCL